MIPIHEPRIQQLTPLIPRIQNCTKEIGASNQTNSQNHLSPEEAQSYGFKIVSTGNPTHGTILSFGQFHNRPEFKNIQQQLAKVATSQKSILDDLIRFKPKHVFVEGRFYSEYKSVESSAEIQLIYKDIFAGYLPERPLTTLQSQFISELGAANVYAFLNSDVTLHGTTTEEASNKTDKYVKENLNRMSLFGLSKLDKAVINTEREQLTMRLIQQFLEKNPQQIALIYGGEHDFSHYCNNEGFQPQFYHKDLSGLTESTVFHKKLSYSSAQDEPSQRVTTMRTRKPPFRKIEMRGVPSARKEIPTLKVVDSDYPEMSLADAAHARPTQFEFNTEKYINASVNPSQWLTQILAQYEKNDDGTIDTKRQEVADVFRFVASPCSKKCDLLHLYGVDPTALQELPKEAVTELLAVRGEVKFTELNFPRKMTLIPPWLGEFGGPIRLSVPEFGGKEIDVSTILTADGRLSARNSASLEIVRVPKGVRVELDGSSKAKKIETGLK